MKLHRDPGFGIHVEELRTYMFPISGRLWHSPRSARVVESIRRKGVREIIVQMWCGQWRRIGLGEDGLFQDERPDGNICGTCEGRRKGAHDEDGLSHTPRNYFVAPSKCPCREWGAGSWCPLCGAKVSAARGWNAYGTAVHAPGDSLLMGEPCPEHGWSRIVVDRLGRGGELFLACTAWRAGIGRFHWARTFDGVELEFEREEVNQ